MVSIFSDARGQFSFLEKIVFKEAHRPELKVLVQVLESVAAAQVMARPEFAQALPIHTWANQGSHYYCRLKLLSTIFDTRWFSFYPAYITSLCQHQPHQHQNHHHDHTAINLDMRRCLKSLWSQKEWTKRKNWIFKATSGEHSQPA